MRARIFLRDGSDFRLATEMEADHADGVWRQLEASPERAGRRLQPGDVVYLGDVYLELNRDGGWRPLKPGNLTRALYRDTRGFRTQLIQGTPRY